MWLRMVDLYTVLVSRHIGLMLRFMIIRYWDASFLTIYVTDERLSSTAQSCVKTVMNLP